MQIDMKSLTVAQATDFGNYLLSDERRERVENAGLAPEILKQRLAAVSHADFENWKTRTKAGK